MSTATGLDSTDNFGLPTGTWTIPTAPCIWSKISDICARYWPYSIVIIAATIIAADAVSLTNPLTLGPRLSFIGSMIAAVDLELVVTYIITRSR